MIDRYSVVNRHNPCLKEFNFKSPLSVGNGEFAFTADATGLQTFPEEYETKIPLCTQSQWGWHNKSDENNEFNRDQLTLNYYDTYGRKVGYMTNSEQEELYDYLRQNPHKFYLGQIGFQILKEDGTEVEIDDIKNVEQKLDMWNGVLNSQFFVEGTYVNVETVCHPERDVIAVKVRSKLISQKRLFVKIKFPYASTKKTAANWQQEERHKTKIIGHNQNRCDFIRIMDKDKYFVGIQYEDRNNKDGNRGDRNNEGKNNEGNIITREEEHFYRLAPDNNSDVFSFSCEFSPSGQRQDLLNFETVMSYSKNYWHKYWNQGGIIDFSESLDPRAIELERRVILSQYLTAIQSAGSLPPQETGLTCNSWYGKFHLEMHFWHTAHFAIWNRTHLLEKSLWWYEYIFDEAKKLARFQGYDGARWPKMVGPAGLDSPSPIGPLLIWQQPHPR